MKKEISNNSIENSQNPEYYELLKKESLTSEDAEDLLEQVLYYTPSKEEIHVILDKLSGYMLENPIHLTVELDEDAEGRKDIFVPLKNYHHEYEDAETDEYDQYEFDDDVSVEIFNALRKEKNRFGNYLVQLHIKEILDAPYQQGIADQYEEDAEEILVPKNENWFFDADNAYMQHLLKKDFGVDIQGYSPNIRKNFFDFLNSRSVENITKLKKFTHQFGGNGLKSFLVLEIDAIIGENILKIGERFQEDLQKEKGELVFQKIAEIVGLADQENETLNKALGIEGEQLNLRGQLLEKVRAIIVNFSKAFKMSVIGKYNKKEKQQLVEALLSDLEKSKTDIILLAAALKAAKESDVKIDLEYIKDVDFAIKDFGENFPDEEDMKEHRDIPERNYAGDPLKDAAMAGLDDGLKNPKQHKFYSIRYKKRIVAELRLKKLDQSTYYWGSFNVDADARSIGVGNELMKRAILEEAREHVLIAAVSVRIPVGCSYVEDYGHVIDGFISDYHESGEPLFTIRLDNEKNPKYAYRNEGKDEPIDEEHLKNQCWTHEDIAPLLGQESFVLKFDMQNDFERMKKVMQELLVAKNDDMENTEGDNTTSKYIITRYFREDKEDKERDVRYFVFEKISTNYE